MLSYLIRQQILRFLITYAVVVWVEAGLDIDPWSGPDHLRSWLELEPGLDQIQGVHQGHLHTPSRPTGNQLHTGMLQTPTTGKRWDANKASKKEWCFWIVFWNLLVQKIPTCHYFVLTYSNPGPPDSLPFKSYWPALHYYSVCVINTYDKGPIISS